MPSLVKIQVETLRVWAANSTQICDGEWIKAHCEEHLSAADHSHISPSHGSTLVRNYLPRRRRVSPDKILRAFDLHDLLTRAQGTKLHSRFTSFFLQRKANTRIHTVNSGFHMFKNEQRWRDGWELVRAQHASDMRVRGPAIKPPFETTLNRTSATAKAKKNPEFCNVYWQQHQHSFFPSAWNLLPTESSSGTIKSLQFTGTLTSEVAFPSSYWG